MRRIYGVSIDFIDGFNESSRSAYPDEFICFHRECDGVIGEMILVPGSVYGESHSFINDWMTPVDFHKSGTAHSHPGYSNRPSDADLDFFSHYGGVHFITCRPYDRKSWRAYDSSGGNVDLEVVF
ncbi:MAG: Mov34/MPN/PAD-1 family protein [Candidatus Methanoplasma sp.]|jgi:proteasome lid subunit RPN8/RPN11|nr:Mov34/MPN/PAD-1 family protein [Candidatus Methanoplasma sp.]